MRTPAAKAVGVCPTFTTGLLLASKQFVAAIDAAGAAKTVVSEDVNMEPKLALLFALVGVIIALSHFDDDRIMRVKRRFPVWRRGRSS